MKIASLTVKNWMNFKELSDVPFHNRNAITYLHLVPQLLKHADEIGGNRLNRDPFGQGFLQRVAETKGKTQGARLRRIQAALSKIVPEFRELSFEQDEITGAPHFTFRASSIATSWMSPR
jgi:hypothetical protein